MKKNYLMAVCLFLTVMSGCGNKEQAPQQAEFMKKNYLMAVCLFLTVMSGCGNKEQAPQQAEHFRIYEKELSDGRLFVSDCDVRVWK